MLSVDTHAESYIPGRTYVLWINPNGGVCSKTSIPYMVTAGHTDPFDIPLSTRDGYYLVGYSLTPDAKEGMFSQWDRYQLGNTVYAIWSVNPKYSSVEYDAMGGTGSPSAVAYTYSATESITISTMTPTRVGYNFLGWSTDSTSNVVSVRPGDQWSRSKTSKNTLYAVWERKEGLAIVQYDPNSGINAPDPVAYEQSTSGGVTLSTQVPTKVGYTFEGWTTESGSTDPTLQPGDVWNTSYEEDTTLFAVWEKNSGTFVLYYSTEGGLNTPAAKELTPVASGTTQLSRLTPKKIGYTFLGWSTNKDATVATYPVGSKISLNQDSDVTLYAVWTLATYTVTYNANGGINPPVSQSYLYELNKSIILSLLYPSRYGFDFDHWAPSTTSTEIIVPGSEWSCSNVSTTLYAMWVASQYTLSFDGNGGISTNADITYSYQPTGTFPVVTTAPTREGCTFLGWANSKDATKAIVGSSFKYGTSSGVNTAADATMYAVWGINVLYDANGGTGAPAKTPYALYTSGTINLSTVVPTKPNNTFVGWSEDKNATEATYLKGAAFSRNHTSDTTLYAVWAPATYSVTFNANGGTGAPAVKSYVYSTEGSVLLPDTRPTKANSFFWGWAPTSNATTATVQPGDSWALSNSSKTLYAVWKTVPVTYTLSFNANGGTGIPEPITYEYSLDGTITLPATKPTNDGAYFIGWSKDSLAEDATIKQGSIWSKSNPSTTLYAIWGKGNENLIDSTASDYRDLSLGEDKTQGKVTEYYSDSTSESSSYDLNTSIAVFVTKSSMIKLQMPKTLILGVTETDPLTLVSKAQGSYRIGLLGDLGGKQKIHVSFPERVALLNGTKSINAAISSIKSDWLWADVNPETYTYAESIIGLSDLTAGSYKGVFNINFEVTRNK